MALRFANDFSQQLRRTAALPSHTSMTLAFWVYLVADVGNYTPFFYRTNNGPRPYLFVGPDASGTLLQLDVDSVIVKGTDLALATWYHVAMTASGASHVVYLNGVTDITVSNSWTPTNDMFMLGNDDDIDAQSMSARMAAVKIWGAALTQAEVQQEMRSFAPHRTEGIDCWLPCVDKVVNNNALDYSGNGHHFTISGALTTEDGPPIAWRQGRRRPYSAAAAAPPTITAYPAALLPCM